MYQAKSFEDIYRLKDFLNSNGIKPEDIIGIYRKNKYQDLGGFDLLYIEPDKYVKFNRVLSDKEMEEVKNKKEQCMFVEL